MREKYTQGFGGKTGMKEAAIKHTRKCEDNIKQDLKRNGNGGCGEDSSAPGQEVGEGFENTVIIFSVPENEGSFLGS